VFYYGETFLAIVKFGITCEGENSVCFDCFSLFYFQRMRKTALAWMNRVKLLEGNADYDKLSTNEIREVINVLETGLQRAYNSLNVLERDVPFDSLGNNASRVASNHPSNANLANPGNINKKSL
jgi:hypothetical protein